MSIDTDNRVGSGFLCSRDVKDSAQSLKMKKSPKPSGDDLDGLEELIFNFPWDLWNESLTRRV